MSYMAFVPVQKRRKPFWGNLALAGALILVNTLRAVAIFGALALSAKGNLLDPRRYR